MICPHSWILGTMPARFSKPSPIVTNTVDQALYCTVSWTLVLALKTKGWTSKFCVPPRARASSDKGEGRGIEC